MSQQSQYLKAMGIQQWVRRDGESASVVTETPLAEQAKASVVEQAADNKVTLNAQATPIPVENTVTTDAAAHQWQVLRDEVRDCTQCALHQSRTQTVFGVGNQSADWLIIGEAPGSEEDKQGEPFVGAAGQLLTAMLKAIDLPREDVYIANILKCRPPNNRDPQEHEVEQCDAYLQKQIALIQPRIVLAFGRVAAQNLLKTSQAVGKLRGQVHCLPNTDVPLIVTYHPAYLLRSPGEKRKAWEDLKLARKTFAELTHC